MNRTVNVAELKDHLSEILADVERGVQVTISRRNKPIAQMTSVPARRNTTRLGFDQAVKILGDIEGPVLPESDWNALVE